jgi:hypothetical protein
MRAAILSACLLLAATPAAAQAIDGATAQRQLFAPRGVQLAVSRSLSEQERAIMGAMVKEADRTGQSFRFYGSIAYSPSEGLTAESLQGAFNFHSTAASDRASVARCNQARKSGSAPCQVAAQVLPRGYESGRVQLSYDATNGFRSTYRRVRGAKAMAISDGTGAWKMAEGVDAADATSTAVALCNEAAAKLRGPADCRTVIAD